MSLPNGLRDALVRLCAPPGSGWATSKDGVAPLARELHTTLFGTDKPSEVTQQWLDCISAMENIRAAVIGVPYDGGTYGLGGAVAGPIGIRSAAVSTIGRSLTAGLPDLGDIRFFPGPPLDEMLSEAVLARSREVRFGSASAAIPVCTLSAHQEIVQRASSADIRVLSIGGDHSISASAILGLDKAVGLIHIDAHGDLSTGRDGLVLLHSSWIHYVDRAKPFKYIIQVGVSADENPPPNWTAGRILRIPPSSIRKDPSDCAVRAVDALIANGLNEAYLSIDIDAIDMTEAPATGLPAIDGIPSVAVQRFICEMARWITLIGADLVEVAPPLSGARSWAHETTCATASRILGTVAEALLSS